MLFQANRFLIYFLEFLLQLSMLLSEFIKTGFVSTVDSLFSIVNIIQSLLEII